MAASTTRRIAIGERVITSVFDPHFWFEYYLGALGLPLVP